MKNRRFNTASFMENLWGERHSTSRVHLISVGIHFDIFWEKIIAIRNIFGGWTGTENGILWKKSINHQSCSFQRSDQHKGTKKCTKSQIFAERQIQFFLNYRVFHFILSYILYYFIIFLLIYLFILPQIDPGKKISPPPPRQGFLLLPSLSRVATARGNRECFLSYRLWRLWNISAKSLLVFAKEMNKPKRKWPFLTEAEDKDLNERKNWNSLRDWHQNLYFVMVAVNTDGQVVTCFNTTLTGKAKIDM